jgi:hypothetical protein
MLWSLWDFMNRFSQKSLTNYYGELKELECRCSKLVEIHGGGTTVSVDLRVAADKLLNELAELSRTVGFETAGVTAALAP